MKGKTFAAFFVAAFSLVEDWLMGEILKTPCFSVEQAHSITAAHASQASQQHTQRSITATHGGSQTKTQRELSAAELIELLPAIDEAAFLAQEDSKDGKHPGSPQRLWVWNFIRRVKTIPAFDGLDSGEAWTILSLAAKVLRSGMFWQDAFEFCEEDMELEVLECWPKVKVKAGQGWIDSARDHAKQHPLDFSQLSTRRTDGYMRFIETCYWMQADRAGLNIFISIRTWARAMGVSQGAITRYRRYGQEDGFLTFVAHHPRSDGKADEFRFNMSAVHLRQEETQCP